MKPFACRRARTLIGTAIGAMLVTVCLSACVQEPPAPAVTIVVTETATPTPTPTPPPAAAPAPPPEPAPLVPNAPAAPKEPIPEGPADDTGAIPGATGAPTRDADGNLSTYTVVSGDAFFEIAQRFDLPQQQLLRMNPSIPGLGLEIYIGDVINLDWTKTK
ncbi:LysM peptidoglycan-binding domain-containing protein [Plantibacter sp. Mn2098]|uniref:LysM peptidoglycan-binding domain-containing protein n=1 Tax=Plantibacter sp. Mn2098 TaxID=3395266 RepID=UPI003BBD4EE1